MDLSIELRETQGVAVVDLRGRVVMGEECNRLRSQFRELLAAGKKKIVFNLGGVARIDSTGIGLLVEAVIQTTKEGGAFKLANLPRLVHNTLALHRLLAAFEVYEKEEEALASFQ